MHTILQMRSSRVGTKLGAEFAMENSVANLQPLPV
jgi:hypothetical protein